ncbi:MAG: single-stranded-DNA-specific exonuclease RecJ [Thermoanaerobaculia bacterium]
MPALWVTRQPAPADGLVESLEATGLSHDLALLLGARGVTSAEAAAAFLSPAIASLHDPLLLKGMAEAVDLLMAARERGERVAVIGDYDVDGLTATALLVGVFQAVGIPTHGILPNRHAGGYGPQPRHMQQSEELGCRLVVTADSGIRAYEALAEARRRGLTVIVTDHHLPGAQAVDAAAVINPRQAGCSYPFQDLAGVGLALKLAAALLQRCGREVPWAALCRMACLGTIADAAPLIGENRVLASRGLAALAATPSVGLRALLVEAEVGSPVSAQDVGFRIGPRLNAAGRLGAADPALELLLTRDAPRAKELAAQLGRANHERRALEKQVVEECAARYAGRVLPQILVGWSPGWHRGVVGIAAGRLARQFHRPAVLFAVADGVAVGSGRSVPGVDLYAFLSGWEGQLERFGGHAQAIGLTTMEGSLAELAAAWESAAAAWRPEDLAATIEYDQPLALAEVTPELLARLARLEPYGVGNPEPVFRFGPCRRAGSARAFGAGHLSFEVRDEGAQPAGSPSRAGAGIEVVAWQWAERAASGGLFDGAFEMLAVAEHDHFRNRPRLRLVESRPVSIQSY